MHQLVSSIHRDALIFGFDFAEISSGNSRDRMTFDVYRRTLNYLLQSGMEQFRIPGNVLAAGFCWWIMKACFRLQYCSRQQNKCRR